MKGYKAFNKGLICRGKQYAENTVFEEENADICKSGMHFCERPIDVLKFYSPADENGELNEFAEVEALDEAKTDDNIKYVTKKLKVGAKIDIFGLVRAELNYIQEKLIPTAVDTKTNSGYSSVASNSGYSSVASNSGYSSVASNSGDSSVASNSGDSSVASNSGYRSVASNSGYRSVASNSGYSSVASNSGYRSVASNSGDSSVASNSGDSSVAEVFGDESVACAFGIDGRAKGKKGCWITLAEWAQDALANWHRICVKTRKVDGKQIKEDTYYKLVNGKFVEVE